MLPETRDGFRFRGGHAALDLTATLAARLKAEPRELLATTDDLEQWLASAGLAGAATHSTAEDLATARTLREAVYTLATKGTDEAARTNLNQLARAPAAAPQLLADGAVCRAGTAQELLAALARDAVELLQRDNRARIRQCAADGCAILFLDTSRAGDRRWCSMNGCGNKAKVAEFRRRKRAAADA